MVGSIARADIRSCCKTHRLFISLRILSCIEKWSGPPYFLAATPFALPPTEPHPFPVVAPASSLEAIFSLQLFSLFLWSPQLLPPPPFPHLKQTLQESRLLLQRGGLFARQARTRTTRSFMHSRIPPKHRKAPPFSSSASKDGPDCASDFTWSTM